MKLYYSPGTCSLAAHIVAEEIGLPLELEEVDLKTKQTRSGADFTTINPKGYVPALVTAADGVLTENLAILQYLAAARPGHTLTPDRDSPAYYRQLEWLGLINSEIHKAFTPLWHPEYAAEIRAAGRKTVEKWLNFLERHLTTRSYLSGAEFTLVDAYCFAVINWCRYLQIPLNAYPALQRYLAAIEARPAVRRAMVTEGLAKAA